MSTAIVIGATGMVGKALVRQLLLDPRYAHVIALVRRGTLTRGEGYREHVVDFDQPRSFADLVSGDVLFSTMGTTRGQAGSVAAQRKVDYDYQLQVAKLAVQNGVHGYVLVSSTGAKPSSLSAYMKMKGELDRDVQQLSFSSLQILRPGPLTGPREKPRFGENVSEAVLGVVNAVGLLRSMRPISDEQVASAMRHAATLPGTRVHEAEQVFALAASAEAAN